MRNEIRFARSREKILFFFASFRFEFFASNQSEINTPYFRFVSLPKIFRFASFCLWSKEPSSAKYSKESRLPCFQYTGECWLPGLLFTRKFFCKPVLRLVQSTLRCRLRGYSSQGSRDSPVYSPPGSRDSPVYSPPGSWDSPVYSSSGSRFGHRGVISLILGSIQQSLKQCCGFESESERIQAFFA